MDPIKVYFSGKGKPKEVIIPPEKKLLKIKLKRMSQKVILLKQLLFKNNQL